MTHTRSFHAVRSLVLLSIVLALPSAASAHVILDQPNGGEVLQAGSTYTITWHILIQHDLQNWDLWYSTDGGLWMPIAMDLPPGDPTAGSIHTYDWTVPNVPSTQVLVRVQQDNSATDYIDDSNDFFTIEAGVPTGVPTVSEWGVATMALLMLTAGTLIYARRRAAA